MAELQGKMSTGTAEDGVVIVRVTETATAKGMRMSASPGARRSGGLGLRWHGWRRWWWCWCGAYFNCNVVLVNARTRLTWFVSFRLEGSDSGDYNTSIPKVPSLDPAVSSFTASSVPDMFRTLSRRQRGLPHTRRLEEVPRNYGLSWSLHGIHEWQISKFMSKC